MLNNITLVNILTKKSIGILGVMYMCLCTQAQDPLYTLDRDLPCVSRSFYVYIHIVKDSLGLPNVQQDQINHILNEANRAFAPICVSFKYCAIDTIDDYSFLKINDEVEIKLLTSRFHKKRRINLYIVNSVLDPYTNSFSYHNGISKPDSAVVIIPHTGGGIVHELGHTFGLYHTFSEEFGKEFVARTNCMEAGDLLCDTPADPNVRPDSQCNLGDMGKDDNGDFYQTEVANYMTHYFCAHCFFTSGQYERMADNYEKSEIKIW